MVDNKDKKNFKKTLAIENIEYYFKLLETRFCPEYDKYYIEEIRKFSERFNIRLSREQKLKFCKKCNTYLNSKNLRIRLNSKLHTNEYTCLNCKYKRRFKYK